MALATCRQVATHVHLCGEYTASLLGQMVVHLLKSYADVHDVLSGLKANSSMIALEMRQHGYQKHQLTTYFASTDSPSDPTRKSCFVVVTWPDVNESVKNLIGQTVCAVVTGRLEDRVNGLTIFANFTTMYSGDDYPVIAIDDYESYANQREFLAAGSRVEVFVNGRGRFDNQCLCSLDDPAAPHLIGVRFLVIGALGFDETWFGEQILVSVTSAFFSVDGFSTVKCTFTRRVASSIERVAKKRGEYSFIKWEDQTEFDAVKEAQQQLDLKAEAAGYRITVEQLLAIKSEGVTDPSDLEFYSRHKYLYDNDYTLYALQRDYPHVYDFWHTVSAKEQEDSYGFADARNRLSQLNSKFPPWVAAFYMQQRTFCTFLNGFGAKGFGSVCTKQGCDFVHKCLLCKSSKHGLFSATASGWTCPRYKKYQSDLLQLQKAWKMVKGQAVSEDEVRELFARLPVGLTRVIDEMRYAHIAKKNTTLSELLALKEKLTKAKEEGKKMTKTKLQELENILPEKIAKLKEEVYTSDYYPILPPRQHQVQPEQPLLDSVPTDDFGTLSLDSSVTTPSTSSPHIADVSDAPDYVDSDDEEPDLPDIEVEIDFMYNLVFSMRDDNKYAFGKGVFMSEMRNTSTGEVTLAAVKVFPHFLMYGKVKEIKKTIIDELTAVQKIKSDHTVQYIRSLSIVYPPGSQVKYIALVMKREQHLLMDYITQNYYSLADSDYLRKIKPLVKQLVIAFQDIHAAGIIHRDVKPENILLSIGDDGMACVKVCDFGFCKTKDNAYGEHNDHDSVASNTYGGTYIDNVSYWIAPEVAHCEGKPKEFASRYTRTSDIWPLGLLVFYIAAKGYCPMTCKNDVVTSNLNDSSRRTFLQTAVPALSTPSKSWLLHSEFPMLYDLIDLMVQPVNTRISLADATAHPFFWEDTVVARIVSECTRDYWSHKPFFDDFDSRCTNVLPSGGWNKSDVIFPNLTESEYDATSASSLFRALRNVLEHPPGASRAHVVSSHHYKSSVIKYFTAHYGRVLLQYFRTTLVTVSGQKKYGVWQGMFTEKFAFTFTV